MKELWEILGVFALSAVKFGIAGVPAAVFAKFSFFKAVLVTTCGGITGAVVFTHLSHRIIHFYFKTKDKLQSKKPAVPKKKFTATNKLIIKAKQKFGLTGIAIITPLIMSFPLGCFVAVRYFHNRQKIILFMSVCTFGWSMLLFVFYNFFYHHIRSFF